MPTFVDWVNVLDVQITVALNEAGPSRSLVRKVTVNALLMMVKQLMSEPVPSDGAS